MILPGKAKGCGRWSGVLNHGLHGLKPDYTDSNPCNWSLSFYPFHLFRVIRFVIRAIRGSGNRESVGVVWPSLRWGVSGGWNLVLASPIRAIRGQWPWFWLCQSQAHCGEIQLIQIFTPAYGYLQGTSIVKLKK
jgi:hypothetical protein